VNVRSTAFAAVDFQGQEAEDEEETGHSKTDSIHCRIPHQLLTGVTSFNAFTNIFVKRNTLFHLVSHGPGHHDAAEQDDEDEVERVHEARAPGLSDPGAAAAAQGAAGRAAAAGQLARTALR